jgi:hypothetical protein
MPFIPRQVKPPVRVAVTCKVPEELATVLRHYAEFLDSTQEYVVTETLRVAFRRDKEFHAWLAATHPETQLTERDSQTAASDQPRQPGPIASAAPLASVGRQSSAHAESSRKGTDDEPPARGERGRS